MKLKRGPDLHYDQSQWIQWQLVDDRPAHNCAFIWWPIWDEMALTEEGGFHSNTQAAEYAQKFAKKKSLQLVECLYEMYKRAESSKFSDYVYIDFREDSENVDQINVLITGLGLDARHCSLPRSIFHRMTNESCWLQFHDIVMHAANSIHHKHYEEAEVEQPATDNLNGQTA